MAVRRGLDQTLVRHVTVALIAGVALYLLTEALSPYDNLQLATMAYYFVAVAGLTVLTGQNGQISLGHGAVMAVGAYATVKAIGPDPQEMPEPKPLQFEPFHFAMPRQLDSPALVKPPVTNTSEPLQAMALTNPSAPGAPN